MKNPKEAVKQFSKGMTVMNAEAINNLGLCYDQGLGVMRDPRLALKYYQHAAELGNKTARKNVNTIMQLKAEAKTKEENEIADRERQIRRISNGEKIFKKEEKKRRKKKRR